MAVAPGEKEYNRRAAALALAATGGSDTTDTTHRTNAAGAEVARAHGATPPPARAHASYASHPSYSPPPARALSAALAACPAAARARLVAALAEVARLAPAEAVEAIAAALREPASAASPGLIPPHGGYEALEAYRAAEIIHDATVVFCERFVNPRSRTHDQMVQAARSGKQNQVEGSVDSATSKKLELKLVGVARGSLEELLRDYTDYLRQHRLELWDKDDPRALAARRLAYEENRTYETYETSIRDGSAEVAANTIICLIHQASFLLDRQLQVLEQAFLRDGGFTERLYQARRSQRGDQPPRCERH
jgi:four helix bundle suffix protein